MKHGEINQLRLDGAPANLQQSVFTSCPSRSSLQAAGTDPEIEAADCHCIEVEEGDLRERKRERRWEKAILSPTTPGQPHLFGYTVST